MNRQEFTDRTKFRPSLQMYELIEEEYMKSDKSKNQFCADFLNDVDGVASRVQSRCDLESLDNDSSWQEVPIISTISQEEYLSKSERQSLINDEDARKFINLVTGFDINFIDLVREVPASQVNLRSGQFKPSTPVSREPFYKKHNDCYVRFKVMNRLFEIVDGKVYICIGNFFEKI